MFEPVEKKAACNIPEFQLPKKATPSSYFRSFCFFSLRSGISSLNFLQARTYQNIRTLRAMATCKTLPRRLENPRKAYLASTVHTPAGALCFLWHLPEHLMPNPESKSSVQRSNPTKPPESLDPPNLRS